MARRSPGRPERTLALPSVPWRRFPLTARSHSQPSQHRLGIGEHALSITGGQPAYVIGMKVRDQHEIDLLGGIAGAAKAGFQATERPTAPPLSRAGIHENDLLPSVHEEP